ncbi:MAG: class I SAM-dependent methyltransferase [Candidatus Anstonellales archaeon]
MRRLSKIQDIEEHLKTFADLTSWSPALPGSMLRAPAHSYHNWGIQVLPDNVEWLYAMAQKAYEVEWAYTDKEINLLVGNASQNAGLSDVNTEMNKIVGAYAAQFALMGREGLAVMDIGAGTGATSIAFLNALGCRAKKVTLLLVEPSLKRLQEAQEAIAKLGFHSVPLAGNDVSVLKQFSDCSIDMIISNAAIHHNSFNVHLAEMNRVLKQGAPLINGDWHSSISESPARAYWLLYLLQEPLGTRFEKVLDNVARGAKMEIAFERQELKEFRKYFGLTLEMLEWAFMGLSSSKRKANTGIMRFWFEIGRIFSQRGEKSPIYFLEAHERAGKRIENLKNAGFEFDEECRRKYKELLRKKGIGELACVMVAKKRVL